MLNCTIYLRNANGVIRQIYISNGGYTQQYGTWYDILGLSAAYIAITVSATDTSASYIQAYLEVLVPNTSTYNLLIISFEIK